MLQSKKAEEARAERERSSKCNIGFLRKLQN
jgi:hypothetical protein